VTTTADGVVPQPTPRHVTHPARVGRLIAVAVGIAAIFMVPWTVFLGFTLPRHYDARHWSLLWIGFDVIVCVVLAAFAWLTWKRRQLMLVMAVIAGTLMFCDAWFDVVTSWGNRDHWVTIATAVFAELPLAVFMYWLAYRAIRRTLAAYAALVGQDDPPVGLLRAPALFIDPDPGPDSEALSADLRGDDLRQPRQSDGARAGMRSITNELRGALDNLSLVSDGNAVDQGAIAQARQGIAHALARIETVPDALAVD